MVLLIGFGSQIGCGLVGRFLDPSDLDFRALGEPDSRWIVVGRGAVSEASIAGLSRLAAILVKERAWRVAGS